MAAPISSRDELTQKIQNSLLLTPEKKEHWLARLESFTEQQGQDALAALNTAEQELSTTLNTLPPEKIEAFQKQMDALFTAHRHASEAYVQGTEEATAANLLKSLG